MILTIIISGCKAKEIITKPEDSKEVNTANQDGNTVDYEEAVNHHYEIQSDRTKQMMLLSDKKRSKYNAGISRSWYDNLFNNSCFRNSCMVKTGHQYETITKSRSCFIKR